MARPRPGAATGGRPCAGARSARASFAAGVRALAPINVGVAAFGMVFGAAAAGAGLSLVETLLMSLLVFSGAAQFTGVTMLAAGANAVSVVLTTLALGLRHVLMGASLAPYLRGVGLGWRAFLAFQMVDESYAVAISRFRAGNGDRWFFLGANLALYVVWAVASWAGFALGALVPDPAAWGLHLIFPLIFLGLLAALIRRRADFVTALLAGVLALAGSQLLPDRWYLVAAALVASFAGAALDRGQRPWAPRPPAPAGTEAGVTGQVDVARRSPNGEPEERSP